MHSPEEGSGRRETGPNVRNLQKQNGVHPAGRGPPRSHCRRRLPAPLFSQLLKLSSSAKARNRSGELVERIDGTLEENPTVPFGTHPQLVTMRDVGRCQRGYRKSHLILPRKPRSATATLYF